MADRAARDPLAAAVTALGRGPDAPPGIVLGLLTAGEPSWSSDGVAQAFDDRAPLAEAIPIGPQTRTDLGSVTKIVATTTALMSLVDHRVVALDQPVGELLPEFADRPVAAARLSDLLEHRAGLWEWWPLYLTAGDPTAALDVATALPLRYRTGQDRHYSDLGFQLLGAAVARSSGADGFDGIGGADGIDLAGAIQRAVLDPWGLDRTSYAAPVPGAPVAASSTGDRIERDMIRTGVPYPVRGDADAFTGWRRHVLVGEINDGNAFHAFGGAAGHAGLFSCADDLARFGATLLRCLRGEGPITATTATRFVQAGIDPGQALGFRRWTTEVGGCRTVAIGHTGFPGVAVAVLPEHDATVVLVTNRLHVAGVPRAFEPMWLDALSAAHHQLHR